MTDQADDVQWREVTQTIVMGQIEGVTGNCFQAAIAPGWGVVVWSDLSEQWENDWDRVLHTTREGAEASATEALRAGYLPQIVRLMVEPERPNACPYECTNCQQLARMGIAPNGRRPSNA